MTYQSVVSSFVKGFSNSELRFPFVYALLSCGHSFSVAMRPSFGRCCKCSHETDLNKTGGTFCACGSQTWTILWSPTHPNHAHNDTSYLTQIGDSVTCETCAREAEQITWLRQLERSTVLLSRFRHGSYYFYRHDPTSPSGKMLIGGVMASPKIEAVLNELRYSPLSPTEGLREDVAR